VERTTDGVLVTFTDMTRIAEAEARLEELRRRIDAMLRFVLDMAERSLPHEAASVALRGRLRALADTYRLVSGADWAPVPLAELVGRELADFGTGREGRVVADGVLVLVRADTAVTLGMALHELAARAAAGGALSVPQGRVRLDWGIEPADGTEQRLVIRWRESGGPAGETQSGGARELIERGLAEQIGASLSISPAEGGLTAEIALPLASGLVLLPGPEGK
jgi:two-component sensor histidine kinase